MIKGSEIRKADYQNRATATRSLVAARDVGRRSFARRTDAASSKLLAGLPLSFNAQQWRALYARRGTEHWQTFFDLLVEGNKTWAKNAAVLVVFISRKMFDYNDEPSVTHSYDAGAAGEFRAPGLPPKSCGHGMEGFDYDRRE